MIYVSYGGFYALQFRSTFDNDASGWEREISNNKRRDSSVSDAHEVHVKQNKV